MPWRAIAGTRDRLVHAYFDVDHDRLWQIVSVDLPALVVPAREARTLPGRIPIALGPALAMLGVPQAAIEREVEAMAGPRIGKTASRQLLGSMSDFRQMMMAHPWPPRSLTALSLELAEAPCGPIGMRSPDDLTRELLAATGEPA